MKKYYLAAIFLSVALAGASTQALAQNKGKNVESRENVSFTLTSPENGAVLRAGQEVEITWELTLPKEFTRNPWSEMEFFLQTGEGLDMRITHQMSVSVRAFTWTVPAINTSTARLMLQCGIEGDGDQYFFAQTGTFSIRSKGTPASIMLNTMEKVRPGEELGISWTSNLESNSYDVMVSYDRGAHFHKAGSTTETRFTLPVDEDFAGSITVQIVSRSANGSKVRSLLTRDATVLVGDKEDL